MQGPSYTARSAAETENYRDCLDVHELPAIFHYWSNRYLRPKLEAFGFSSPQAMFLKYVARQLPAGSQGRRVASIGAGNCQLEVELASHLLRGGAAGFTIDCLELNSDMLNRGREAAAQAGVTEHLHFVQVDLNTWGARHEYDAVIANQSLHHVLRLEHLFAEIRHALKPGGCFVISDMIGRNGHQRWPEALAIVREFWRRLPPSYRFNHGTHRYEETYEDYDCSGDSFEGIRAQDILPLLLERFQFELFIAFGNLIDAFVDRNFGSNFDPAAAWDRNFIDKVHERDEREIAAGNIKPTHLLGVMGTDPGVPARFREPLSPRFCLRDPSRAVTVADPAAGAGLEYSWPHDDRGELEMACRRLTEAQERTAQQAKLVRERTEWAGRVSGEVEEAGRKLRDLQRELSERTAWARQLDGEIHGYARRFETLQRELEQRTAWAQRLDQELAAAANQMANLQGELEERTAWARALDREIQEAGRGIAALQQELEERTAWARALDRELQERTLAHRRDLERLAWASAADRWFHAPLDWIFRLLRGIRRR